MPSCYCEAHNCNGAVRDPKTVKRHGLDDKKDHYQRAQEAYEAVLNQQDEEIAVFVSALTIADPEPTEEPPLLPRIPHPTPLRPIHEHLRQLTTIENDMKALKTLVEDRIPHIAPPSKRSDEFPLSAMQAEARDLQSRLASVDSRLAVVQRRKEEINICLYRLQQELGAASSCWHAQRRKIPQEKTVPIYASDHHFTPILAHVDPIIQLTMFTMTVFDVILGLSRRGCHYLLFFAGYLVQLTLGRNRLELSDYNKRFVANFPVDPDTVTKKFALDGKTTIYAVCPKNDCHQTYKPSFDPDDPIPKYPDFCTHKRYSNSPACGTAVTERHKSTRNARVPIKRFMSFSFKDFIAALLSRAGFEDCMDNPKLSDIEGELWDVFDGQFLKKFTDADDVPWKSTLTVGRYVFSLGLDFFNPYGNKQAGKKCSIGVISLVCLNLPVHLRYKTENMFLAGVIPGPKEPKLDAINPYLTPVVDEFLEFWNPGVRYSRTAKCPEGRLIQLILAIVICDLLAARKTAGFASHAHEHFCSVCDCLRSVEGYSNTDFYQWRRRTNDECRAAAERYRNAQDPVDEMEQFNRSGMRWSELLRLPYLDITRCLVVDSMHNLLLGQLKEHFTNILGIGNPKRASKVLVVDFDNQPGEFTAGDRRGVKKLKKNLESPIEATIPTEAQAIKRFTTNVTSVALKFVCRRLRCLPVEPNPTKPVLARALYNWRRSQTETEVRVDSSTRHGHVFFESEMQEIWKDIESTLTPSWVTSVPSNLGSTSHGKLKADQWRVLGTVHLPLALTRLWGTIDPDDPRSIRCRKILDATMLLFSAVRIATSHTITAADAESYLQHMLDYLNALKKLFPEYNFRPNHHMSLHIYEFLLLFGPVHSWWTFPFERLIGALQRMPHNFQIGQLEQTIATSYTRASNLRAILFKEGCPEVISNCSEAFQRLIAPQNRNSLQTILQVLPTLANADFSDLSDGRSMSIIPVELSAAFQQCGIASPPAAYILANISVRGLTFSVPTRHQGNSNVIIKRPVAEGLEHVPAQIASIVQFPESNELYFAIRRYKSGIWRSDRYRQYRGIGASLWRPTQHDLEIVSRDSILGHFACLPLKVHTGDDAIVVLPLWRGA